MMKSIERESAKRLQRDPSGGGGGGSSDSQHMGEQSKTSRSCDSRSSPSSGGTEHPNQNDGDGGNGNKQNDVAGFLHRFAPNSRSDVGNELDLLDLVHETEQCAIVQSFALKCVAPCVTGQHPRQ